MIILAVFGRLCKLVRASLNSSNKVENSPLKSISNPYLYLPNIFGSILLHQYLISSLSSLTAWHKSFQALWLHFCYHNAVCMARTTIRISMFFFKVSPKKLFPLPSNPFLPNYAENSLPYYLGEKG